MRHKIKFSRRVAVRILTEGLGELESHFSQLVSVESYC